MQNIGGQAVIEGVMMRSADKVAIAVRKPDKEIVVKKQELKLLSRKFQRFIFIRGIINLIETLVLGIKAMNYSAGIASGNDGKNHGSSIFFILALLLSFGFALLIFKLLPLLFAQFIINNIIQSVFIFNLVDGAAKLSLFILYVLIISRMKDVKEVFKYHGAEHMAIYCHENRMELTTENVRKYPTCHPRCGTSFIAIVIIISIIVYMFIPRDASFLAKFGYRIALLPLIAGISYEALKLSAKYENKALKIFSLPGLLIQRVTTKKPRDDQIEVAIASLKAVI
jgi:uncharacterized protein YqhQ